MGTIIISLIMLGFFATLTAKNRILRYSPPIAFLILSVYLKIESGHSTGGGYFAALARLGFWVALAIFIILLIIALGKESNS